MDSVHCYPYESSLPPRVPKAAIPLKSFFPIQSTLHCPRHSHEALHLEPIAPTGPFHLLPSTSLSNGFYLRKRKQGLIHIPLKTIRRLATRYKSFELVSPPF